ncbi:MAG: hypothetical protein E6I87_06750 [Chloroflexi bacterium]|nr:MAG: hypothetical protein E6I87_06750 [Chloroflexota bacterium]
MISDPALLLVSSIIGLAIGATVALLRAVLPRWIDVVIVALFAIGPLALIGRTPLGHSTGQTLWEWSAVGGPTVQAAYHVDPLAVIAAGVIAVATGVALHSAVRFAAGPLVAALLAVLGIILVALVAVTDAVVAALIAGTAATVAVAVGLFVAPAAAAARLAALLALGVEALIAAALLLARAGVASFDLEELAPSAASSGVVLAVMLAGALFGGLYPFVPWRYERSAPGPASSLFSVRGAALFPTGVAATAFAFRVIAASGQRPDQLRLPDMPIEYQALLVAIVLILAALAVRSAPRRAIRGRAITGAVFVAAAIALPLLSVAHVMALLALLSVVYATVASTALVGEWSVARFTVRLAVLWAALASGAAPALAAALFGLVASSLALALESAALVGAARGAVGTSARLLHVVGPFLALAGVAFAPDPFTGALAGVVLGWAALLELGHAVREAGAERDLRLGERAFAALVAIAAVFVTALLAAVPATAAAVEQLGSLPAEASDLVLAALSLVAVGLAIVLVALPGVLSIRLSDRTLAVLGRVLAASDPVPALSLAYRGIEAWSERIGAGFAALEDRVGVWLATALIALALIWAATT